MLTDAQQRNAAKKFAAEWNGRGYEKGETHAFWMELLQMVCGVVNPAQFITFEGKGKCNLGKECPIYKEAEVQIKRDISDMCY